LASFSGAGDGAVWYFCNRVCLATLAEHRIVKTAKVPSFITSYGFRRGPAADWYRSGKGRMIGFGLPGRDASRIATPAGSRLLHLEQTTMSHFDR
jgi:hypothetical protein